MRKGGKPKAGLTEAIQQQAAWLGILTIATIIVILIMVMIMTPIYKSYKDKQENYTELWSRVHALEMIHEGGGHALLEETR